MTREELLAARANDVVETALHDGVCLGEAECGDTVRRSCRVAGAGREDRRGAWSLGGMSRRRGFCAGGLVVLFAWALCVAASRSDEEAERIYEDAQKRR